MSNIVKDKTNEHSTETPRRALDVVKVKDAGKAKRIFDAFWIEGEVALLFGEAGTGKSVLAVQIADALTRGDNLLYPGAPLDTRRKVLYVDLVLSERQFRHRYSGYSFLPALYRDAPPEGTDLLQWTETMVTQHKFDAVIIDELSMVSRTDDGIREKLRLMSGLRRLAIETGVSILVLANSIRVSDPWRAPERGLRRSQALCGLADSVFTLLDERIVQTRARNAELVWPKWDPLYYGTAKLESGLLGFEFEPPRDDEDEDDDDDEFDEILEVVELREGEDKMTFRQIGVELGISKSYAQVLYAARTPEIEAKAAENRRLEEERAAR